MVSDSSAAAFLLSSIYFAVSNLCVIKVANCSPTFSPPFQRVEMSLGVGVRNVRKLATDVLGFICYSIC